MTGYYMLTLHKYTKINFSLVYLYADNEYFRYKHFHL